MTTRTRWLYLVVPALLALSACSATGDAGEASLTGSSGAIELAVSETCEDGSDPQCISVNDESVLLPSAFERAGVKNATVGDNGGEETVDVTFSEDGAAVWHTLTEQAAGAGTEARLVIKIGSEVKAATRVMATMEGDSVQIIIPSGDSAQKLVDQIRLAQ